MRLPLRRLGINYKTFDAPVCAGLGVVILKARDGDAVTWPEQAHACKPPRYVRDSRELLSGVTLSESFQIKSIEMEDLMER